MDEEWRSFPGGSVVKNLLANAKDVRHESDLWVGKIPWRRAWQPTVLFLPGESLSTGGPGRLQSMELRRVGHDSVTNTQLCLSFPHILVLITLISAVSLMLSSTFS